MVFVVVIVVVKALFSVISIIQGVMWLMKVMVRVPLDFGRWRWNNRPSNRENTRVL